MKEFNNIMVHEEIMKELYQLYCERVQHGDAITDMVVYNRKNNGDKNAKALQFTLDIFKKQSKAADNGANIPEETIRTSLLNIAICATMIHSKLINDMAALPPDLNVDGVKVRYASIHHLYIKKNHDYGDSFHMTFLEEGFAMARIRLSDKINRYTTLAKTKDLKGQVSDETIIDTLVDTINYAVMTVIELERKKYGEERAK